MSPFAPFLDIIAYFPKFLEVTTPTTPPRGRLSSQDY